jgi:adenylate cyclase
VSSSEANYQLVDNILMEMRAVLPATTDTAQYELLRDRLLGLLQNRHLLQAVPESKKVTILLADIRGFTALAETYSAVTIISMLNRFYGLMSEVIVKYGGTIDKLMGDSIMVLFGAPVQRPDDVQRAMACAVEMQQTMNEFNQQNESLGLPALYIGIGINTGDVVAGSVGSDHHREYTVIGDQVNLASRIEAQSLRGQILLGEATYQLAKDYILAGQPNQVQVKGRRQPVTLYELLGTTRPRPMTVPRREVRKSPRIHVQMPCFFQIVDGKTVMSQEICGDVIDIGYNGLLMMSPVRLDLFTEIRIRLSLHLLGSQTTDIYARVVNTDHTDNGHRISLEFTAIDLGGQQAIKQFVDSLVFQG